MIEKLLLLLLLLLSIAYILLNFFSMGPLVVVDFLSLLFLLRLVQQCHVSFLVHFHLHPHLLFLLDLLVSSPLRDNISGLLTGLIDFLISSILFLLQK
jgi:hypothetical protein